MSDNEVMFSLLSFMAAIGAIGILAVKFGTDSRRDAGRQL
jgi:hypothetical protein